MMKLLMGKERTYRSMYEDSIQTYEFFDQFIEESNSVFQGSKYEAPMLNVMNSMEEAKSKRSVEASLKLDLFLTSCLKRKIAHELRNPNIDMQKIQQLVQLIKDFDKRMVKSDNHRLTSEKIMDSIKRNVEDKYEEVRRKQNTNNNHQTSSQPIAASSQNVNQNRTEDNFDKANTEEIYHKILTIVTENKDKRLTAEAKKQVIAEIIYYEGYLMKSLKTAVDVKNILNRIVYDFSTSKLEQYTQKILLDSLITRYHEITPNSSSIQQSSATDYADIKNELSTLKSRYNEILSDKVIDSEN